ncbi:hypothetical protein LTR16_012261, partial [Cryomyces antarcticus]
NVGTRLSSAAPVSRTSSMAACAVCITTMPTSGPCPKASPSPIKWDPLVSAPSPLVCTSRLAQRLHHWAHRPFRTQARQLHPPPLPLSRSLVRQHRRAARLTDMDTSGRHRQRNLRRSRRDRPRRRNLFAALLRSAS